MAASMHGRAGAVNAPEGAGGTQCESGIGCISATGCNVCGQAGSVRRKLRSRRRSLTTFPQCRKIHESLVCWEPGGCPTGAARPRVPASGRAGPRLGAGTREGGSSCGGLYQSARPATRSREASHTNLKSAGLAVRVATVTEFSVRLSREARVSLIVVFNPLAVA